MSDHIWAQEQIASYLTGGLAGEERERLDRHAKDCSECAAALAAAIHFDRGLGTLFAPLRPKPGLEDRAVQAVRIAPKAHAIVFIGWPRRITAAAAAIIAAATFGALGLSLLTDGKLPLPGEDSRRVARNSDAAPASAPAALADARADLTNEDAGLQSNLEAAVDLDRLSAKLNQSIDSMSLSRNSGVTTFSEESMKRERATGNSANFGNNSSSSTGNGANSPDVSARYRNYNTNGNLPGNGFGLGNLGGGGFAGGGGMPTDQRGGQDKQLFSFYTGLMGGEGVVPTAPPANTFARNSGLGAQPANSAIPPVVPVAPAATVAPGRPQNSLNYFVPGDPDVLKSSDGKPKDDSGGPNKGDVKDLKELAIKDGQPQPPKSGSTEKPPGSSVPAVPEPEPTRRVVLRSGDIEFEVESFDSGLAAATKLVNGIKNAFVGTVNSEKLPNGKVKGSITVRVPPESLDGLVLDLRKELGKGGELKSVRLASQDVTKQYTDTESRLKAARAMETRLLKMIAEGKGEIKQLLEAERELGIWRTKIEESEGELRYYASNAALSTLIITLMEKEIRAAVGVTENEYVQAGVEVEDVDKSYQAVLKEVLDAKGRVLKSEVKQLTAGQFNAMVNFEVAPDAGGPIRDRLRQLGRVARLEIDRQQQADGGTMPKNAPVKRGDTVFKVQLYNLANIAPRETAAISVAVADVAAAYNTLRDAVAKAAGRVAVAQLNENDKQNVTAQLDFDIKRSDEGAIRAALAAAGEATSRNVTRAPESDQTTDTKIQYRVSITPVSRLRARDAIGLQIAAGDVTATYTNLREAVLAAKGRITASNLDENDRQNVKAALDFEIRRADEPAIKGALDAAGELLTRQIAHAPENEAATDSKVLYNLRLVAANRVPPRETTLLGLEVHDVDQTVQNFTAQFNEVKGRQIEAKTGRERGGKAKARLVYEVPLASASGLVERFKGAGAVRALDTARDTTAPDGKSATARIEITLANADAIIESEDGMWTPVKKGLTYSASFLLRTMTWVVFALCAVLPWALLGYGGYRVVRRVTRSSPDPVPAVSPAPAGTPHE